MRAALNRPLVLVIGLALALGVWSAAATAVAAPLPDAVQNPAFQCEIKANGRDEIALSLTNRTAAAVRIDVPAGLIFATEAGDRMLVLRNASFDVPVGGTADISVPCAALSQQNRFAAGQSARLTPDSEPRVAPLLKRLAEHNDVPRSTAQIAALTMLEDVTFAQWQAFLAARRQTRPADAAPHPDPAEIAEAIDALGILRQIAPDRNFALAGDPELKLRALRTPLCRGKAMQLYGMTIPGDVPAGQVPPDLGQLLHTKPGDNCPICRMRQQMQKAGNDL